MLTLRLVLSIFLQQLFRPPLETYDLIIHLARKQLPRQHEAVDREVSQLPVKTKGRVAKTPVPTDKLEYFPVYDYDPPSLFLNELKVMLDFYNSVNDIRSVYSIYLYGYLYFTVIQLSLMT